MTDGNRMKALLIIDILHDFIDKDRALTCGPTARKIIPFIRDKIRAFRSEGNLIVFIRDRHEAGDPEFQMFPPHCVENTYGTRIIEELPVLPGDLHIDKKRFEASSITRSSKPYCVLRQWMKSMSPRCAPPSA